MSEKNSCEIRSDALSVEEVYKKAVHKSSGAVNIFVGTVRNENKSRSVSKLEYEAYESMVVTEFGKIAALAESKWTINKIIIQHRTGILEPGDIAVIIAVSTGHRRESFEACSFIIEELKKSAPIWKKEIYEDGEEWLEAHP